MCNLCSDDIVKSKILNVRDTNGRKYASMSDISDSRSKSNGAYNILLVADNNFDCIKPGSINEVKVARTGDLYIPCSGVSNMHLAADGVRNRSATVKHFLHGQLLDNSDYLLGLYPQNRYQYNSEKPYVHISESVMDIGEIVATDDQHMFKSGEVCVVTRGPDNKMVIVEYPEPVSDVYYSIAHFLDDHGTLVGFHKAK